MSDEVETPEVEVEEETEVTEESNGEDDFRQAVLEGFQDINEELVAIRRGIEALAGGPQYLQGKQKEQEEPKKPQKTPAKPGKAPRKKGKKSAR